MEKYEKYRLQIVELLKDEAGKVTLTKKIIKRNSYVFSVGEPQYLQSSIIFENSEITVFEEGVSKEKIKLLKEIFETL